MNITQEVIKDRMTTVDYMVAIAGMCKDDWDKYEMPTYYECEVFNEEEWNELMDHAHYMINRLHNQE